MLTIEEKIRIIKEIRDLESKYGYPPLTNVDLDQIDPKGVDAIAVGSLVLRNGYQVLVRRRDVPLQWIIPGGVIESGETVIDSIIREVKEETGLKIQINEILRVGLVPQYSPLELREINLKRFGKETISLLFVNFKSTALSGTLDCSKDPNKSITEVEEFEKIPFEQISYIYKVLFVQQGIVSANLKDYPAVAFAPP